MPRVTLREVREADLRAFFEHQRDPAAVRMAAFYSRDPSDEAAFRGHWRRILADPATRVRTIVADGHVVGNVVSFAMEGQREVGYLLGREHWGHGFATEALAQFLAIERTRPLHARAASDNVASRRVLEKCGFRAVRTARAFASGRGEEIEETVYELG